MPIRMIVTLRMRSVLSLTVMLALTGCYHATIETGQAPSPSQVDVPWAHSFLYGLVPPSTLDVENECGSGVARVETQLSFLNLVASSISFGLYTPMHLTVTCAAMEEQSALPLVRTEAELAAALRSGEPFLMPTE